jgi:protein Tex
VSARSRSLLPSHCLIAERPVPFVARYRKEATGALDDIQLRRLEERLRYLRELDERRAAILDSVAQQGKLDPAGD